MLSEITRFRRGFDMSAFFLNLRILCCTGARCRGLDLLDEKGKRRKAKWRQNQIRSGRYLFTATWTLSTVSVMQANKVD